MVSDIPILIISFNRPDKTAIVINRLREIKPSLIFFSVDGPRDQNDDDLKLVEECRTLIQKIDWQCEVRENFASRNMGSGVWPFESINWAFQQVEYLMIIEDDVEISPDFYNASRILVDRYKNSKKVFSICASNICPYVGDISDYDYFFTKYFAGWGWVTWKDRWTEYEFDLSKQNRIKFFRLLQENNFNLIIALYFYLNFLLIMKSKLQAWDYQVNNLIFKKKLVNIKFYKNLSKNSGTGSYATHTRNMRVIECDQINVDKLQHPNEIRVYKSSEIKWRKERLLLLLRSILSR